MVKGAQKSHLFFRLKSNLNKFLFVTESCGLYACPYGVSFVCSKTSSQLHG